jgi:hypothetical protein
VPRGRFGGNVLGARTYTMDVLVMSYSEFHIKLHICNKVNNFTRNIVVVYGAS